VFSADGRYLAGAGVDRAVYIWNTGSWKLEHRLEGQPEMITALALSRDGGILVAGGNNELSSMNPVKVLVWDVANRKIIRTFDAAQTVISAAVSPDGTRIAAATAGKMVHVWQFK
jgi:WD40 repeat protein